MLSLSVSWDLNAYLKARQACESSDDHQEAMEDFIKTLVDQDLDDASISGEDMLDAFQPHKSLEVLSIEGYIGRMLPCWMMESSLPKLVKLSLTSCIRCEQFPAFGQLPFLKVLELCMLPGIKILSSEFSGALHLLEELALAALPELEEWSGESEGELFPSLVKLTLFQCPKLKELPSSFPSVRILEMYVDDITMINSLQNSAFPNLEHLGVGNCDDSCHTTMPEVLKQRMSCVESWSTMTRMLRRCSSDSATESESDPTN